MRRAGQLLVPLLAVGCVTVPVQRASVGPAASGFDARTAPPAARLSSPAEWVAWPRAAPAAPWGQVAAKTAASVVGVSSLHQAGEVARGLPDDCTGLVRLAWRPLGVDLYEGFTFHGENGVTAMYAVARDRGTLHRHTPSPGDLVFFRETYDRNRDGRENDGLTHVAVVESVDVDGTVTLIHRINAGVRRSAMTLAAPQVHASPAGRELNDFLRPASKRGPAKLTGELFVGYASPAAEAPGWAALR